MPKWGKVEPRRNQKERAIVLIAFHGFVLAQLATNTSIRDFIATFGEQLFIWPPIPNTFVLPIIMAASATGAYCAYWALAHSGADDAQLSKKVEGELRWALIFALASILLAGVFAAVAVKTAQKVFEVSRPIPDSVSKPAGDPAVAQPIAPQP